MGRKRGKRVGRVRNDSNVDAANNAGNMSSQRIQKEDANVSNCDSKNLKLSQADNDATLNKNLPSASNVIVSADTNQEKHVTKDLNRNKGVVVQGSPTSGASLNAGASKLSIPEDKARTTHPNRNKGVVVQGSPTSGTSLNAGASKLSIPEDKARTTHPNRNKSAVVQGSPTSGASLINAGASKLSIPEDKARTMHPNRDKSAVVQGSPTTGASLINAGASKLLIPEDKARTMHQNRDKSAVVQRSPTTGASLINAGASKLSIPEDKARTTHPNRNTSVVVQGSPTSGASLNAGASKLLIPEDKARTMHLNRNTSVVVQGSPTSGASLNAGASKLLIPEDKARTMHLNRNMSVVVQGSPTSGASLNAGASKLLIPEDEARTMHLNRNMSVVVQGSPTSGASLNAGASKLSIPEDKARTICGRENDICWAVNEAHGAQLAAEAIEMGKGYPVAEFERFVRSASPVICPTVQGGQGAPLSRREIPNISLWNLWQWFEKDGNYGLQVKAEEHTTHCLKFSAYFNPSLSAVQLFKDNRTQGSPAGDFHTRFSLLVPKPRVENASSSDSRASSDCSAADPPVESKLSDELLFEYFEREQPQSRKPFFEKIQELAAADGPSSRASILKSAHLPDLHPHSWIQELAAADGPSSRASILKSAHLPDLHPHSWIQELAAADGPSSRASILKSAHLPDLHPHSWFCVAWYPIYRIPSGNFRASFLTYHSLGHYVHRGQTIDAPAGVVCPIVGLQSYNAQGECWFQPRYLNEVTVHSVLQERVRTLQQTAFFMSRAVGTKGAETFLNKHHDYEFFVSRWC